MMSSTPSSTSTAGTPTPRSGFGRSTPRARSSTPCSATSSPPTWGPVVALARASDGVVDWSLLDAPVVEEVVGPNGVDFVTGDGDLAFGSGIRVRDMVGPFELVVCDGAGRGRAELQLPSCLHHRPLIRMHVSAVHASITGKLKRHERTKQKFCVDDSCIWQWHTRWLMKPLGRKALSLPC
ncbi:uncharacterized protein [Triticum aestivum]|uniref:uncharacterized protein isoform X1 n=1 Tax=Triticum aestivum TaxID=4565 RepID=UPI001D02F07F|nr:uncharacterized protein LOC123061878 isoform X1 [Triticum aestivum]